MFKVVAKGMVTRGNGGSIVNVSSRASASAVESHTSYCASKGALDQVMRVMALELGPHQVSRSRSVNQTSESFFYMFEVADVLFRKRTPYRIPFNGTKRGSRVDMSWTRTIQSYTMTHLNIL